MRQGVTWQCFPSLAEPIPRIIKRLGNYDLDIQHRAGKAHGNADALSRRPCGECKHCPRLEERDKMAVSSDCITKVCMLQTHSGGEPPWLVQHSVEDLQKLQSEDDSMSKIISWKNQGERPPWKDVKHEGRLVRILWSMWKFIYLKDGILYKKDENTQCSQLIVPMKLKQQILTQEHNHRLGDHFGVKKTLHNVRSRFWWPGMPLVQNLWSMPEEEPQVWLQDATLSRFSRITHGAHGDGYTLLPWTNWKWQHLCSSSNRLLYQMDRGLCTPWPSSPDSSWYISHRSVPQVWRS